LINWLLSCLLLAGGQKKAALYNCPNVHV